MRGCNRTTQLRFTHQPTAVYYLMHLIDRAGSEPKDLPLDLRTNKEPFRQLYQMVYPITDAEFEQRFHNLLLRDDGYGHLRAGRLKELVYDIRKHVVELLRTYGENPKPYTIGADHHLRVPCSMIRFVGRATLLQTLRFK